jgi:hypothetical protein
VPSSAHTARACSPLPSILHIAHCLTSCVCFLFPETPSRPHTHVSCHAVAAPRPVDPTASLRFLWSTPPLPPFRTPSSPCPSRSATACQLLLPAPLRRLLLLLRPSHLPRRSGCRTLTRLSAPPARCPSPPCSDATTAVSAAASSALPARATQRRWSERARRRAQCASAASAGASC